MNELLLFSTIRYAFLHAGNGLKMLLSRGQMEKIMQHFSIPDIAENR